MARTYRKKSDDEMSRAWRIVYRLDCWDHYEIPRHWETNDRPPIAERTKRRDGRKDRSYKCTCTRCVSGKETWRKRKVPDVDLKFED